MEILYRLLPLRFALLGLVAFLSNSVAADELKLNALLVWGTNELKPEGKDFKPLPEELRNGLRPLRWKNYYVVKTEGVVASKKVNKVVLSERCTLTVQKVAPNQVETQLFNPLSPTPNKPVFGQRLDFKDGHRHAIAGDSKDNWDDAWAVYLVPAE